MSRIIREKQDPSNREYSTRPTPPPPPSSVEQLAIICVDTSLSMKNPQSDDPKWTRSHEVAKHLFHPQDGLFSRMIQSRDRDSFYTQIIAFDTMATPLNEKPVKLLEPGGTPSGSSLEAFPLLKRWGNGTSIFSALFAAKSAAEAWISEDQTKSGGKPKKRCVTIIIVSDGCDNIRDNNCLDVAERIRETTQWVEFGNGQKRPQILLAAAPYGPPTDPDVKAGHVLLEKIVTEPAERYCKAVTDGAALRDFLVATIVSTGRD